MVESIEYDTVVNLRMDLRIGFKKNTINLADLFYKDGLIDDACQEKVIDGIDEDSKKANILAFKVVESIKGNKEHYHLMMKTLVKSYRMHRDIIQKLNQEYVAHGGLIIYLKLDETKTYAGSSNLALRTVENPSEMTETAKKHSFNLTCEFNKMLVQFQNFLENGNHDISRISLFFNNFHHYPSIDKRTSKVVNTEPTNISSLMKLVSVYCSFFNFKVLESLMELTNFADGLKSMENYKKLFADYLNEITIRETPGNLGICFEKKAVFVVQMDDGFKNCRQYYLHQLIEDVKRILQIEENVIFVDCVRPGSIRVVLHFPISFQKKLKIDDHHIRKFKDINYEGAIILQIQHEEKIYRIHIESDDRENIVDTRIKFISENMEDIPLTLASCLNEAGLLETEYWLFHLKQKGIDSVAVLKSYEGNMKMYKMVVNEAKSDLDKHGIRKLLKIDIEKHESSIENKQVRSDSDVLSKCSGGLALQGILLTDKIEDLLEPRSTLLKLPRMINITKEVKDENTIRAFSSRNQKETFKRCMEVLGSGIVSLGAPLYGSTDNMQEELEKSLPKDEEYASTLRCISIHTAVFSLQITDFCLSEYAKKALKSALLDFKDQDINDHMQRSCENFFKKYGSHFFVGPLKFGGRVLLECSNINVSENERENILKLHNGAISLSDHDFTIEMNAIVEEACQRASMVDVAKNTVLVRRLIGGDYGASSMTEWKNSIEEQSQNWVLTDRGKKLVPVWDMIEINHENELGDVKQILKCTWEKMSGLKVADSNVLVKEFCDTENLLAQVSEWSQEPTIQVAVIQQRLQYILEVKKNVSSKLWITNYLSHPSLQTFLKTIMFIEMDPATFDCIQSITKEIIELHELNELIEAGKSNLKDIATWLYYRSAPKVNISYLMQDNYDFQKFIDDLRALDAEKKENPEDFLETLTNKVDIRIKKLRSRYQHTYEDILTTVLVYPYCKWNCDMLTLKQMSLTDVKELCSSFICEVKIFTEKKLKSCLLLQSMLLMLAISVSQSDEQLYMLLKEISKMMKEMEIWFPVEREILTLLNNYFENYSKSELIASLDSVIDKYNNIPKKAILYQSTKADALDVFDQLGLKNRKLQLRDVLCIRKKVVEMSLNEEHCTDTKLLPYLILQKLMSYDSLCRSDLMHKKEKLDKAQPYLKDDLEDNDSDDYVDSDDEYTDSFYEPSHEGIHPVDGLLAVLICSDDFLRQDLFSRMAQCQLAIPFVMPNPISEQLIIPLWAMRSIVKDWMSEEKLQHSHPLVTYPMPIISILRFGNNSKSDFSKSKILNEVICDDDISFYFHRGCRGGQYKRFLGEGLVDMTWYLPAGQSTDIFPQPITFLNLHGDAHEHFHQANLLCKISSFCLVMLVEENFVFEGKDETILEELYKSNGGLTILNACKQQPKLLKRRFRDCYVINTLKKQGAVLKDAIRKRISKKIMTSEKFRSIEDLCKERNEYILLDEDSEDYKTGYSRACKLAKLIPQKGRMKQSVLPLQGKQLWQLWGSLDKELNRQTKRGNNTVDVYSAEIENKKKEIRIKQERHLSKSVNPLLGVFVNCLLNLDCSPNAMDYFLYCLKLQLNNFSREVINIQQQEYHSLRIELSKVLNDHSKYPEKKIQIEKQLRDLQEDIIESSFGLEHLLREVGQVYETFRELGTHDELCSKLSITVAQLILEGFPLELMDGDAAHVPLEWVKAVLTDLANILDDQKVFVLSVVGLQSTGKSTMLNTTFGLQFNVSAGRCTRGAFMQLLSLDDELKTETGLGYILVVDTEGLRAPEHDPLILQKHDNELATFVIGLANMTFINIYGEVPGDMDDILQTSVHAFLRMTRVKFHPSCQFVHHNASPSIKGEVGSSKFTQKLNKFTIDAAKEEHCEGQYESFNDVIKFDDETDVHYFPGLWKGNPPLAPINPGYSHTAQRVKLHFIETISKCTKEDSKDIPVSGSTISNFTVRLQDLWEALLNEKFVFSFKNTLEIIAYKALETKYGQWDWDFQVAMLEWKDKVENEIKSVDFDQVSTSVNQSLKELQDYVFKKYKKLQSEMKTFFDEDSEILVQWRGKFEVRLKLLSEELKLQGEEHCNKLLKRRNAISKFEERKKTAIESIKEKVQQNIESIKIEQESLQEALEKKKLDSVQLKKLMKRNLFAHDKVTEYTNFGIKPEVIEEIKQCTSGNLTEEVLEKILVDKLTVEQVKAILKNSSHTEEELNEEFDVIWKELVGQIAHTESKKHTEVANDVEIAFCKYFQVRTFDSEVIEKIKQRSLIDWAKAPKLEVTEVKHFVKTASALTHGKHYFTMFLLQGGDRFQIKATEITNKVLFEAQQFIKKIVDRGTDFTVTYVQELIQYTDSCIEACCLEVTDYQLSFTNDYKIEVIGKICSLAIPEFQKMAKLFDDKNNPLFYLQEEKAPLLAKYKIQYKQTETEEAIAETLCAYFENPLRQQMAKKVGTKLIKKMKKSETYLANKLAFKIKILLDLKEENNFFGYIAYINDMQKYMHEKLTLCVMQFADQKSSSTEITELQTIAQKKVKKLVGIITEAIYKAKKKDSNMSKWLQLFCDDQSLPSELGFSLKISDILVGYDDLEKQNLDNLIQKFSQNLKKMEKNMLKLCVEMKSKSFINDWKDQLNALFETIIGCKEQCPFCREQCDLMKHDDSQQHTTDLHRIECVAGWRYQDTSKLSTRFCPSLVAGDESFIKANGERQPYKHYRSVYPNWSIRPNVTSKCTLHWKWFVVKYRDHLAEEYRAEPADIPPQWLKYDWEAVKKDLLTIYNLKSPRK